MPVRLDAGLVRRGGGTSPASKHSRFQLQQCRRYLWSRAWMQLQRPASSRRHYYRLTLL